MALDSVFHLIPNVAIVVLSVGMVGPQALRLFRTHDTSGISASSILIRAVSAVAWLAYAIGRHEIGPAISEGIFLTVILSTAGILVHRGAVTTRAWMAAGLTALALATTVVAGALTGRGLELLGLVLAASTLVYGLPSLVSAMRASKVSGLSLTSLTVTCVDATLWGAIGAGSHDVGFIGYSVTQLAMTGPVLVRVVAGKLSSRRSAEVVRPAAWTEATLAAEAA